MSIFIDKPRSLPAGESCLVAEFSNEIIREANDDVATLGRMLTVQKNVSIIECMPMHRSLPIYFDTLGTSREALEAEIKWLLSGLSCSEQGARMVITVYACYGGAYGPDIQNVAGYAKISVEKVIRRRSARACHCFMIGFMPNFAYFGGMDESSTTQRLANPRTSIEASSVEIAGKQASAYPIARSGGKIRGECS